jgi:hypothetical protein
MRVLKQVLWIYTSIFHPLHETGPYTLPGGITFSWPKWYLAGMEPLIMYKTIPICYQEAKRLAVTCDEAGQGG